MSKSRYALLFLAAVLVCIEVVRVSNVNSGIVDT
jgi:hypothetical protein